jgi:hypothetical protein
MRLVDPTDYEILGVLSDGKRDNAVNIATKLDRDRGYINTRLPVLKDYELVDRVGPSERSGLYVISKEGLSVLRCRAENQHEDADHSPGDDE